MKIFAYLIVALYFAFTCWTTTVFSKGFIEGLKERFVTSYNLNHAYNLDRY